MGILRDASEFLKAYLPLSKRAKGEYLEKVSAAVRRYKPLIEERTDIDLDEVQVKYLYELISDMVQDENLDDDSAKAMIFALRAVYRFIDKDTYMARRNSTIYIHFGLFRKSQITRNKKTDPDSHVVHEMTHMIWEKIGGAFDKINYETNEQEWKNFLWREGYAMYGEFDWFSDFYPEGCKLTNPNMLEIHYQDGRNKVKEIVERYGQDVLLEIPLRWQEFDKELDGTG